jgi:hypothetical protein
MWIRRSADPEYAFRGHLDMRGMTYQFLLTTTADDEIDERGDVASGHNWMVQKYEFIETKVTRMLRSVQNTSTHSVTKMRVSIEKVR